MVFPENVIFTADSLAAVAAVIRRISRFVSLIETLVCVSVQSVLGRVRDATVALPVGVGVLPVCVTCAVIYVCVCV